MESKGQRSSSTDIEFNQDIPTQDVGDEPYIDFGDTIELSDDDIAF